MAERIKKMAKIINREITENEMDVRIDEFSSNLSLEILYQGEKEYMHISTFNINRPGLQLAGFYEHFAPARVQVMGEQEMAYLKKLSPDERMKTLERLFKYEFPCLVVSTVLEPCDEIMQCAKKYGRVVLRSKLRTTMIMNELSIFLNQLLAPTKTIHGVLMDLYGVGILILGHSSVGKSETAIELISRGHRLVADDAVTVKRVNDRLVGASPSIIRFFMEMRGIGIVDVRELYGVGAVKLTKSIDMVVELETWDETKEYDRLGTSTEKYEILEVQLPKHTIPVKPGRNLAVILEVAARNYRLKSMGYDTLAELDNRMKNNTDDEEVFLNS